MRGVEFLRKIKRLGQKRGIFTRLDKKRGKGSHATLYYETARTILQDLQRELPGGTLRAMLRQPGLRPADLEE
jgi:mRNA interferase HicA